MRACLDSFGSPATLTAGSGSFRIYRLDAIPQGDVGSLPFSLKVLLENLLRHEDGETVRAADVVALAAWDPAASLRDEVAFRPARVLLQDFTGVPVVADLAAMREAFVATGGDGSRINPLQPVDLVIDHSVQVDSYGLLRSFDDNVKLEFERNRERYRFLKWAERAFRGLRVVPPGTGIVHQVNLEYLASVVATSTEGGMLCAYPDTLVGTDSHTTMINGLGVLGWGVGGIEAEAAMLGQPISMLVPQVVGFELVGKLREGVTATDLVLTAVQLLRARGVVDCFVEFFGDGLDHLTLPDRATIANMAPEYGATMGYFPIDDETIAYLRLTGRAAEQVDLVERYAKEQGLFRRPGAAAPRFTDTLHLDLVTVEASLAGPRRPQDRVPLRSAREAWSRALPELVGDGDVAKRVEVRLDARQDTARPASLGTPSAGGGTVFEIGHGDVVIAAITSCTNTSNPAVLVAAGLLARNARARGLAAKPWVKTSLAPGSQVVTDYLDRAGLSPALQELGFHLVGYGCTTCIGNSGPLAGPIASAIEQNDLVVVSVLSGNRNFEGRISPHVRANYLASPPLVVAYAIAGTMAIDFEREPLGKDPKGAPVYLKDVWPSPHEIAEVIRENLRGELFTARYARVFEGPAAWRAVDAPEGGTFAWDSASTYIRRPPFVEEIAREPGAARDIEGARVLCLLGDSVTTDHISPAGDITADGPAGSYLREHGVAPRDFNSFGSRRGNHEVMMRGTFANIRLRNLLAPGTRGGVTRHLPDGAACSIYDAAMRYRQARVPLLVIAGMEYGTGSSRDWAAKGTQLLGVRAVIAESFERIHRSNLIGMGVLPLEFLDGQSRERLALTGEEVYAIEGIAAGMVPRKKLLVRAGDKRFEVLTRIDTPQEVETYRHGGILPLVLRQMATG